MEERTQLLQIMALIVALIIGSFFSIPFLSVALATVRLLLVLVLSVAVIYLAVLNRRQHGEPVPVERDQDLLHEIEHGR